MALNVPKTEMITQEVMNRLWKGFPRIPVNRGFFADEVTIYPSFYIFEDIEVSQLAPTRRRGQYERVMSIMISYFLKGPSDMNEIYERANTELYKLYQAMETDEYFYTDGDPKQGPPLCTQYNVREVVKVFYKTNAIQLAVTYTFAYVESAPWAK